jgi:hypothetical protein
MRIDIMDTYWNFALAKGTIIDVKQADMTPLAPKRRGA